MLTKDNSEQLLVTEELNAFQFRDKVGELLTAYRNNELDHFVFDIETKGLDIFKKDCGFIGFSIADPINKIGYWIGHTHPDIYTPENEKSIILSCLFKLLYNVPVVGHNIIFDLNYMTFQFKLDMKKVRILDDTLFLSYYLFGAKRDTGISLSLKNIFRYFFQIDLVWEDELKKALESHRMIKDRHFFNVPYATIAKYGAYDSIVTYYLRLGLLEKLQGRNMTAYDFLIKSIHAFVDLETTGLAVDWEFRDYLRVRYDQKIKDFEEKIQKTSIVQQWKEDTFTEFNLNSSKMIADILYSKSYYGCPVLEKTPKGAPSTNEGALLALANSKDPSIPEEAKVFVGELLENRNSVKMVTTYLEPLDDRKIGELGLYSPDYNIVGTSTGRLCFVGSTQISLLDGTEKRLDELLEGSEFYVYSSELDGRAIPTKARSLGATKKVKELIEVTLDNGKTERCTPDHKWLKRCGTYCEAQNLKEGDSLMPLYRRVNSSGYEEILDLKTNRYKNTHSWVNSHYNPEVKNVELEKVLKLEKNKFLVSHHKDFNKRNNRPDNLQWMGFQDHLDYHRNNINILNDLIWNSDHYLGAREKIKKGFEKGKDALKERYKDPAFREEMSRKYKEIWDSEESEEIRESFKEGHLLGQQAVRMLWNTSEYRAKMTSILKPIYNSEEYKKKKRERLEIRNQDPEYVRRKSENIKAGKRSEPCIRAGIYNGIRLSDCGSLKKARRAKIIKILNFMLENKLEFTVENYDKAKTKVSKGASLFIKLDEFSVEDHPIWNEEGYKQEKNKRLEEIRNAPEKENYLVIRSRVMTSLNKDPEVIKKQQSGKKEKRRDKEEQKNKEKIERIKNYSFQTLNMGRTKIKRVLSFLEENNLELNLENYNNSKNILGLNCAPKFEYLEYYKVVNHKVVKVERILLEEEVPVYDITILDGPSNFALSSGVFVSNSSYFHTLPSGNDIKRMIVSRFKELGGLVVASDFSQLEVRVCCGVSGDPTMREAYIKGYDVHSYVASRMFNVEPEMVSKGMRKSAKQIVFGILYGKGTYSLSSELDISKEEAQKLIDYFFVGFPLIKKWIDYQHKFLKVNKYVTTPFGRTRYLKDIDSPEWKKVAEAQRAAQNTPIQSVASDLAFDSALRIYYALRDGNMKSKFIGTVHDSILVDSHPDEIHQVLSLMRYHMNDYINETYTFLNGCPIKSDFEVGTSWGGSCALDNFSEKVWSCSGYRLDAENLVERIKIFQDVKHSNFIEYEQNEDKIQKFVDAGKKVKFKIVW